MLKRTECEMRKGLAEFNSTSIPLDSTVPHTAQPPVPPGHITPHIHTLTTLPPTIPAPKSGPSTPTPLTLTIPTTSGGLATGTNTTTQTTGSGLNITTSSISAVTAVSPTSELDDEDDAVSVELNTPDYLESVELDFPPEGSIAAKARKSNFYTLRHRKTSSSSAATAYNNPTNTTANNNTNTNRNKNISKSHFSFRLSGSLTLTDLATFNGNGDRASSIISDSGRPTNATNNTNNYPNSTMLNNMHNSTTSTSIRQLTLNNIHNIHDNIQTTTPPHKLQKSFKFKDYMPKVFRVIRGLNSIDEGQLTVIYYSVVIY